VEEAVEDVGGYEVANPLAFQLDLDKEIENIYWMLKGYIRIGDKFVKIGEPLLSDYGIQIVVSVLRHYLHKGIILSNLDDDDIKNIAFWAGYDLATELMKEYEKTGVQEGKFELIIENVTNNIYATLRRARLGDTAKSLREQIRIEKVKIEERERSKGWFA